MTMMSNYVEFIINFKMVPFTVLIIYLIFNIVLYINRKNVSCTIT